MRSTICSLLGIVVLAGSVFGNDSPEVKVTNVRRAFHNGEHNAFTDLVRFKDQYYLTFRSCPDGHMVHPTASIIVLASSDLNDWKQVHRFSVRQRDTRDPHFLVFKDKLFVYTGTWHCGDTSPEYSQYTLNKHLGYAVWSDDGTEWSDPTMLEGTFGHYIWRASSFDGRAYLCGRRNREFDMKARGEGAIVESLMLESDDGLIWRRRAMFQETNGDETAFQFEPDGRILAVSRRGRGIAQLCQSKPPYTEWQRADLDRYIGGPLLARWGKRHLVGGRKQLENGDYKTALHWLSNGELHEFATLPSGGDNSYPGFVELGPTRAVGSWYSSHETNAAGETITAIYMAELNMVD